MVGADQTNPAAVLASAAAAVDAAAVAYAVPTDAYIRRLYQRRPWSVMLQPPTLIDSLGETRHPYWRPDEWAAYALVAKV